MGGGQEVVAGRGGGLRGRWKEWVEGVGGSMGEVEGVGGG